MRWYLLATGAVCMGLLVGCPGDDTDDGAAGTGGATAGSGGGTSGGPGADLVWVDFPGGAFVMGSETDYSDHGVTVPSFSITKTEITVAQYEACIAAGACVMPNLSDLLAEECNFALPDREDHPVNCVDWFDANDFCAWVGGRLPTEAEWEYAARNGGKPADHPWGADTPTCNHAQIYDEAIGAGCDNETTRPVCSKPAGHSEFGLCDMIGNVQEWVRDCTSFDYEDTPTDGSAYECSESTASYRGTRGGSWEYYPVQATVYQRDGQTAGNVGFGNLEIGIRCAR